MRPAWRRRVECAVCQWEWIAAFAGHHPELIPLTTEIRAVDDALSVRRPIGARLPGRFLVAELAQRRAGSRLHAPESAGAVDVPAIQDRKSTRLNSSHSQISYAV